MTRGLQQAKQGGLTPKVALSDCFQTTIQGSQTYKPIDSHPTCKYNKFKCIKLQDTIQLGTVNIGHVHNVTFGYEGYEVLVFTNVTLTKTNMAMDYIGRDRQLINAISVLYT